MKQQAEFEQAVRGIVFTCIQEATAQGWGQIQVEQGDKANILAGGGFIDSLGLTSLLVTIEQDIEAELGLTVDLSSSITFVMEKGANPLATVGTLIEYIVDHLSYVATDGGI
jgi:acyl carrier protein